MDLSVTFLASVDGSLSTFGGESLVYWRSYFLENMSRGIFDEHERHEGVLKKYFTAA